MISRSFLFKSRIEDELNIILTGFMGTGKSTVGRLLARELNLRFLDLDDVIEKEAGMPISEIFKAHGEARFRGMESDIVKRLVSGEFGKGVVVATGGGVVVNPGNRERLKAWGTLVCLRASLDEIVRRIGDKGDRPLLASPEKARAAEALLKEREAAYNDCHHTVDTTGMKAEEVARAIIGFIKERA